MTRLEIDHQQEYQTRIFFFKTDFKGTLHVPTIAKFHPNLFKGTQEQYDNICTEYLYGKEDEFKIIGIHRFDTIEEYNKTFNKL
jgi:hypothetical protein